MSLAVWGEFINGDAELVDITAFQHKEITCAIKSQSCWRKETRCKSGPRSSRSKFMDMRVSGANYVEAT
jgi:hypothetical protein